MKWLRPTVYSKHRSIVLNKEGRLRKIYYVVMCACMYVCMLHIAASIAVPRLVTYIQGILCPEEHDTI